MRKTASIIRDLRGSEGSGGDARRTSVTFDYFEPGFRIPLVIVSPYARRGYISHHTHYIGSLLHLIEHTYGLSSLGTSDARSDRFADCFDFTQEPLPYIPVKVPGSFESLFDTNLPVYGRHPQDPAQRD
jgi:phospholipase C